MSKFIVVAGNIKKGGKLHKEGAELELSPEEVARINKKGICVEASDVVKTRAKAAAEAKAAVEKAEKDAAEKLKAEKAKGGGK